MCRGLWPALDWTLAGAVVTTGTGAGKLCPTTSKLRLPRREVARAGLPAAGPGTGWLLAAGHVTEPATGPSAVLQQQEKSEARHEVVM